MATVKLRNMYHRVQVYFFPASVTEPLCANQVDRDTPKDKYSLFHQYSLNFLYSTFSWSMGLLHRKNKTGKKRVEGANTCSRVDRILGISSSLP